MNQAHTGPAGRLQVLRAIGGPLYPIKTRPVLSGSSLTVQWEGRSQDIRAERKVDPSRCGRWESGTRCSKYRYGNQRGGSLRRNSQMLGCSEQRLAIRRNILGNCQDQQAWFLLQGPTVFGLSCC